MPTLIQERAPGASSVEQQRAELAATPVESLLTAAEIEEIRSIGDNAGCMTLKGGAPDHDGEQRPDRWALTPELVAAGASWGIEPERDLSPATPST